MQIFDKKGKTGPAGQSFIGCFDSTDFLFPFWIIFAIDCHRVLHLIGLMNIFVITIINAIITYSYRQVKDFFYFFSLNLGEIQEKPG